MQDWNHSAHELWQSGQTQAAISATLDTLNTFPARKPKGLFVQFAYYLFMLSDYAASSQVLEQAHHYYPDDEQIGVNLVVALSRQGEHSKACDIGEAMSQQKEASFSLYDALAKSYSRLGNFDKALLSGDRALFLKNQSVPQLTSSWRLPKRDIREVVKDKKKVIAFSLWGNQERYINGAIRNLTLAYDIYPTWEIWIYHDNTVPKNVCKLLARLGAKLIWQADKQDQKHRLAWRFQIANEPEVGYFLVRDIDSVFSLRERLAVDQWISSDKWFHTIHDWWTHTDLMLAGLWGGVANVLPDILDTLNNYQPKELDTPNIDQWFLRDCIWPYVRQSCLIHDRLYRQDSALAIPGPTPQGKEHIGRCEFTHMGSAQRQLISAWLSELV